MYIDPETLHNITLESIVDAVNRITDCTIQTKGRHQHNSFARWIYFKTARKLTNKSLTNIGKAVNRDHSTAIHGLAHVDQMLSTEPRYKYFYNKVLASLGATPEDVAILEKVKIDDKSENFEAMKKILETIKDLDLEALNTLLEYRIKPFIKTYKPNTNNN